MLIFVTFVSLWLNESDGCVTLQDPNFVTVSSYGICFVRSASNWCSASVRIVLRQHYVILDCVIMILALCEGKSIGHLWFSSHWPITRCFDVFFDVCLKKWLNKQPKYWWCETPCAQCEVTLMITAHDYELSFTDHEVSIHLLSYIATFLNECL